MRRIKLTVAYDGTGYHGWQVQRNAATIEGVLYAAIQALLPWEAHELIGASRTDAGVHALGNVAVFDTESAIPAGNFISAINSFLPEEVRIRAAEEVPLDFNPRFAPHKKHYAYYVDRSRVPDPMKRLYYYHFSFPLDIGEMCAAARYLLGEHDFLSFVNPDSQALQHGGNAIRSIYEISVQELPGEAVPGIAFHITGNGFLHHMIRIIVGTLLEVGRGKRRAEDMERVLLARDRQAAGPTVPAKGLRLVELSY